MYLIFSEIIYYLFYNMATKKPITIKSSAQKFLTRVILYHHPA
jgi:hypothetical protein